MNTLNKASALSLLVLVFSPAGFADPAPRSPAETGTPPKPYTMFLGSDLSLEWEGQLRPIKGVTEKGYVVDVDGRRVSVPDRDALRIGGKQALKVAPTGIVFTKFELERTYTPANDPKRAREIAANNAAGMSAKMDSERYQADIQLAQLGSITSAKVDPYGESPEGKYSSVQKQFDDTQRSLRADESFSTQFVANSGGGTGAADDHCDALRLGFDITSPTPATGVYMVLVLRLRDPAEKAQPDQVVILGQNIGDIGPQAKAVQLFRGGFPPGYVLVGTQVHVYDERAELASNLAPKRVEITADEAFQFSVVDYIGRHRGADVKPVPAGAGLPATVQARLSAGQRDRTYYVKLGRNGLPTGAFLDEECTQPLRDEFLASSLTALRFYPALKAGKPVESVVTMRL